MDDLAEINRKLADAREAYQRAKHAFMIASDLHDDIANSDGIVALRQARILMQSALDRYQEALTAFSKYRSK